jgi:uncharacterized protein (TIGR02996 family)
MRKLVEHTRGAVPIDLGWENNRVRFGSFREPRGRTARSPLKLVVLGGKTKESFFAQLVSTDESGCRVEVIGGDFDVFLKGRKVRVGGTVPATDGDVLRIDGRRFVIGEPPTFPRDEIEASFLERVQVQPQDDDARLVYADWLEERGDFAHADFLRLELRLKQARADDSALPQVTKDFHALANDIASLRWRVLVARPIIERCDVKLEVTCPKSWDALVPTDRETVRHCNACAKEVVFCSSIQAAREVARRGGCVAIDPALARSPKDLENPPVMLMGRVVAVPRPVDRDRT